MNKFKNSEQIPIISLLNVNKTSSKFINKNQILKNINFNAKVNDLIVIEYEDEVEINSLINIILGLDNLYNGHAYFLGNELQSLNGKQRAMLRLRNQSIISKEMRLFDNLNVFENIYYSLLKNKGGKEIEEFKYKVIQSLRYMGVEDFINKKPKQIPSDYLMKIAYARALAKNPKLIIIDYHISNYDSNEFNLFLEILYRVYFDFKITTILITNDRRFSNSINNIMLLKDGELARV
ncbi:ATP-binding cassette domain-containing protein [Providencia burhodogranariea]|uniref:ABC transporter domain-containing protein n=1 Tax=Providencia burhodogranariea DSM 19968 TaxID=1141662 RepID=K8WP32_9GAMM|nr:ATP-binding cassette domain-containing protein [Providencia burhodogranariea]EKT62334.1 hypothetical protein OOA_08797 [Providencia burhodogranariea DSM 19968]